MNIVDSSVWLEYFAATPHARHFSKIIERSEFLLVPSIVLYEVFKKILAERDENAALLFIAHMKQGKVIDLNLEIALLAGKFSIEYHLPMADSIILATARKYDATIWTLDSNFKKIPGVKYFSKKDLL